MIAGKKPLSGIRVLAVETQVSSPFCTMMLADAGAEVIKIEPPGKGDVAREPGPILKNERGEKTSGYFMRFNRNKKSLTLNLKSEEARLIFKELVKESDVLVENLKPGTLAKMGLAYEQLKDLNPRLVQAAISGFGQMEGYIGPYSERPAYDIVIQAMCGLMNLIGEENGPPVHPMIAFGDIVPGMLTAYAIVLALYKSQLTGQGEYIDVAMFDVMMTLTERANTLYSLTGNVMSRGKETLIHPWGAYKTKDGYVALIVLESSMWEKFCNAIGKPELFKDPRFDNAMKRAKNREALDPVINEWMIERTTEEITGTLLQAGVPVGPVRSAKEVYECPQANARSMWIEVEDPVAGKVKLVGNPIKMKNVPGDATAHPAPRLGEHTEALLAEILGYDSEKIKKMRDDNLI